MTRPVKYDNLDAVISVGYRVNSRQKTQFRIWATQILREYIIKGFAMDDDRLKNGRYFALAEIGHTESMDAMVERMEFKRGKLDIALEEAVGYFRAMGL